MIYRTIFRHVLRTAALAGLLAALATTLSAQTPPAQGDSTVIVRGVRSFLEPNIPNPFVSATTIAYSLEKNSHVLLTVHDFFYDMMITLVDADQPAGRYAVNFVPSSTIAAGTYIYTLRTDAGVEQRRMMYTK